MKGGDYMDDINSVISSILGDPQKMEQLRSVAQNLGMNPGGSPPDSPMEAVPVSQNNNNPQPTEQGINLESFSKLSAIFSSFNNTGDKNVQLLRALQVHISPARSGRIDDAIRIMQVMSAWPAIRDSGLLGNLNLGNLFSGGGQK